MNEIITVNYDNEQPTVSARELHEFLEVGADFRHWFPRMCEYGFEEDKDFRTFLTESSGGRPAQDAEITIDMAKELCMLQRNDKGKQARQYFLQLERDWNSPEKVMARALQIANKRIHTLSEKIEQDAPKVLFADSVATAKTSILIFDLAKIIKQNGVDMGGKRLFSWMRENGYLVRRHCYVAALPLPPQDRVELIRLADAAVTNAEKNGYLVGENEANTSVITKYMEQFLLSKMKQADSDNQP